MTYQMSAPPATWGVAGAGVPLTGAPLLRLSAEIWPVMLVASLARPKPFRSSESNWVSALLTRRCASPGEASVASVQVGDGREPIAAGVDAVLEPVFVTEDVLG